MNLYYQVDYTLTDVPAASRPRAQPEERGGGLSENRFHEQVYLTTRTWYLEPYRAARTAPSAARVTYPSAPNITAHVPITTFRPTRNLLTSARRIAAPSLAFRHVPAADIRRRLPDVGYHPSHHSAIRSLHYLNCRAETSPPAAMFPTVPRAVHTAQYLWTVIAFRAEGGDLWSVNGQLLWRRGEWGCSTSCAVPRTVCSHELLVPRLTVISTAFTAEGLYGI